MNNQLLEDLAAAETPKPNKRKLKTVAAQIVELRKTKGLSQRDLAVLAGTSYANIARIETGKQSPSVDTLRKIAAGLGTQLLIEFK